MFALLRLDFKLFYSIESIRATAFQRYVVTRNNTTHSSQKLIFIIDYVYTKCYNLHQGQKERMIHKCEKMILSTLGYHKTCENGSPGIAVSEE